MIPEIQQLKVYYRNKLLVMGKDYNIENREIVFTRMVERRFVRINWCEVVNTKGVIK